MLFLLCGLGYSQTCKGTIVRVIDGDTHVSQTTDGSFTIRMFGTDAPERDQPFSLESADFLKQHLNKEANFKANGADRYGRTSGTIFIESQDINLLSIKGCYSWHFKRYSSDQQYEDAEAYARENNPGLLRLPNPVPPCEWRKGN